MKFKVGDKVMLKAVPYDNFLYKEDAEETFNKNKNKNLTIRFIFNDYSVSFNEFWIYNKYLKHAVKPKPIKYTIDCRGMACGRDCTPDINDDVKICEFTGTKKQIKAHIKKYWKQPKIKAVK
jgi:hypothetical protein